MSGAIKIEDKQSGKNVIFGEGFSKICLVINEKAMADVINAVNKVDKSVVDICEIRLDNLDRFPTESELLDFAKEINGFPTIGTLRTKTQGGKAEVTTEEYKARLETLLSNNFFTIVDIELMWGEDMIKELVSRANFVGSLALISMHDFEKTPSEVELVNTFMQMKELGADLPKIAVTPQSKADVETLINASKKASMNIGPIIAISMGKLGQITRYTGEKFGSCLTFAASKDSANSSLGQLTPYEIIEMRKNNTDANHK